MNDYLIDMAAAHSTTTNCQFLKEKVPPEAVPNWMWSSTATSQNFFTPRHLREAGSAFEHVVVDNGWDISAFP